MAMRSLTPLDTNGWNELRGNLAPNSSCHVVEKDKLPFSVSIQERIRGHMLSSYTKSLLHFADIDHQRSSTGDRFLSEKLGR